MSSQISQINSQLELDLAAEKREEEIIKLRRAEIRQKSLRFVAFLYLAAILFSVLMIAKPGASIFYYKETIEREKIELPESGIYRYPLETNGLF